ncbi:MAG: hypothetical protein HZB55_04845 [Deltaproteobacteria bacterium]|nr:hypothetical protein [Deltaproteobacteria bacterium]
MSAEGKPSITIRTTGGLFLLSALLELVSVGSPVTLLGAERAGAAAAVYHLAYTALFAVIGAGLWGARRWGARAFYAGGLVYTVDKLLSLWDRDAFEVSLRSQLGGYADLLQAVPSDLLFRVAIVSNALFVLSWWGFALYLYRRRNGLR